jgi:hypothetical protein
MNKKKILNINNSNKFKFNNKIMLFHKEFLWEIIVYFLNNNNSFNNKVIR